MNSGEHSAFPESRAVRQRATVTPFADDAGMASSGLQEAASSSAQGLAPGSPSIFEAEVVPPRDAQDSNNGTARE